MKFKTTKSALMRAIKIAGTCREGRETLPILNHLLVTANGETVSITGSNLDVRGTASCAAEIGRHGAACLPFRTFSAFVGNAPGEEISVEISKERAKLLSGSALAEIPILDAKEFPEEKSEESNEITISGGVLLEAINQVRSAVCNDSQRYVLNSVLAEFKSGHATIVATSGARLHAKTLECESADGEFVIPSNLVSITSGLIEKSGDTKISLNESWVRFSGSDWSVSGKLLEGRYPGWRNVIPNPKIFASIQVGDLKACLRRAKYFTTENCFSVRLDFTKNNLRVSSTAPEHSYSESLAVEFSGEESFGINPDYLLDALQGLACDAVKIGIIDNFSPLTLADSGYTAVVMPTRLQ